MARSTTDSYSVHLETIKNIADFKTRTEAHFTWLEEILVESKRAFARPDIEPLPKTPGTKRGRCRQIKAVPKYCNEDEDENNDSLSKATHEPKARRKLTVETHVDAELSIPDDAIAEEESDVVLECKRGRPQRVASRIASMKWSMQLEIMKRKKLPSQQRLASMSATCLAEVERMKPNQNKLRNVAFSEQPPQQQAEPQDAPVVELHSDSDKESEAEVEPVPKKKPKRGKLSRKKRDAKSSIIHIVESDTEEEPLAEELGCSDSTNSDVFEAGSPTETEQAMAVGVALSPVIVLDRIEVFDPETPKVSKPLNQVVDIKPAADEIHVSKAAITDTVSTPTTQLLLGQSSKQMTPTTPTERFSPYASPPVKSRVKAFEAIAENASIVNISHSSAANTSVNKSILMHQSESVSSSPVDPKMMSAKVMVTNIVCAIKHKYHQIIGTPEKADFSMEQSSVIHASSDTDGEQATEKSAQTNVIKPDSNEPHAPLEMIVEDSVERVCGAVDKEAIVSLHNLSKQEIAEIQRPSLSGDTTEVCRLSNERRSAGRSSVSRRSGRRSSVSRRSGRLSSAMLNRASLQHGHRRSSLLGKKLMKQVEEMQMIKDVKQAAAELRRSSRRSRSIALTDEEMPPPLPTVPPVSKPIRSARTKVQQPKMDVKDLPVVDSNEEAEEPEQTSEPAPQRVTRTKVRQPKMDVKDLPVVDSNEEAEEREQTSEPAPQRVTRTKVRQPKMDVKDLPVVDSNEEVEEPEQTSEPAPQRVTRTKVRQPKMDVKDLPVVDSNEEAEVREQTSEPVPQRVTRTKVRQPKMDVKDLPVVDSNEEAEVREQTSEPVPQRVTRTKVRQPKMDVKDLPVVDSNEEVEPEQTSEPAPQRVTRTKVRQPKMDVKDLPVVDSNEEAEEPEQTSEPAPQRVTRTKTRQMLKSRTSPCSSPSVAACNQVANSAPDGLGKGRQLEESEEERGVATPTEARPRQTTRAVDQNARCRAETPVDRGSSSQKSTDNEASDFCTPPERPMRITRSKMPKKGVAADVASGKPPIHPVAMTDSDGGKRSSRKRPSDSHLSGSARAKQARFKHNGQATNIIRMSRKPNGGKTSSDSDSETVGDGGSADRQPTRTRGAQVVNPGSERRITPPNTCPSNKIIRPGVKTFIGSASKRPANLVVPTSSNGIISSFISRNSPKKEKEARRQHELRRKKEKEEQAARKRREMLQELALEKKRKREESARRVLETRLARQHAEQEKKALLLESRLHRRNPQERERQEKLLQEKQELRMQRQQNAQEKRIQENDQRLNRIREQEEEKLRHDAMFIRKRDFEEQERQEKLAEQKRLQDEKLADLERQRIDELDRQQRIEQEKQREWQRQKEEKELVLEKERQQRKRMELERQREKDRLAQKEIEKQREIARQHLLKEAEEKRQAEEDRKRQEEVARLIQKHNNALKVVNSTANLNSTYNNSSAMGQQAKKNNIDSYELTPKAVKPKLRKTDCYNINDLHSDDSTDNEDEPRKRIPDWAQGVQLKTAIISQHYEMPDINEIFDVMDMPKLEDMFVKLRARFHKRTSSAHWRTPIQHPGDEYSFLDNSMHP